jgi:hypothetical protein
LFLLLVFVVVVVVVAAVKGLNQDMKKISSCLL